MTSNPVEEIKQRLDITELISEYVTLKPAGKYHKALCPIHHEKTPSFMVDRANGIWHCFGCGKGGDLFSFIQEMEGMDFPESLRLLARKANVDLPRYDPKIQDAKTKLLEIIQRSASFYHQALLKLPQAEAARQYLKERQVSEEMIDRFQIGYSPNAWDALYRALIKKDFRAEDIFQAGLTVKKDQGGGYYDRFRNRLMFPISNAHGSIIGFGGRVLPPTDEKTAKYVNSPQGMVYNKSTAIYGLDLAKQEIRKQDAVVVVEGYLDVIASHQIGVTNVVATSGTAFTVEQLTTLKRYASNLLVAFDTDLAGESATRRSIDLALEQEMDVKIVRLPHGKDPDELIKQDSRAWTKAIQGADRIMDHYFEQAIARLDLTKVDGKKKAAAQLLPIIAKLNNQIEQTHYLQKLAEIIQVSEAVLREQISKKTTPKKKTEPAELGHKSSRTWKLSQQALAILIFKPELIPDVTKILKPKNLEQPFQDLYKILSNQYNQTSDFSMAGFQNYLKTNQTEIAQEVPLLLLLAEQQFAEVGIDKLKEELATTLRFLLEISLDQSIVQLKQELHTAESDQDQAKMQSLLERFNKLTEQRNRINIS
ncbi:MAG: DNA primase [bacterium]